MTLNLGNPFSKDDIHGALVAETSEVQTFFQAISPDRFFSAPEDIWTPADNLVHLIKSVSPIVLAMSLPKTALRMRFGKAKHESRSFSQVRETYMTFFEKGLAIASPQYEPQVAEKSAAEREKILAKWDKKANQLTEGLAGWSEADLDFYQVPHPLIGLMTIREILLFTAYHNMHHVNDVNQLLGKNKVEWFAPNEP